jgi:cell wall-associated NlpC family hydrolase
MSLSPSRFVGCILLATVPLALAACGGAPALVPDAGGVPRVGSAAPAPANAGARAAAIAARQVGVPYRYGGRSADGFDCSGLVHYAYARAGKAVPRTTGQLWRQLRPVHSGELLAGDVLFFDIAGKVSHVGLYLGRGRFVHAPSSGREVTVAQLDAPYYREAFVRAGRP